MKTRKDNQQKECKNKSKTGSNNEKFHIIDSNKQKKIIGLEKNKELKTNYCIKKLIYDI